ncbi:MAG: putative zinc-binding metallopeptidase [Steroidobacteraceae bacterium]
MAETTRQHSRRARRGQDDARPLTRQALSRLSDDELLDLRFCDLPLSLRTGRLAHAIRRLRSELTSRGLRVQPRIWIADEWFTPDGIVGFAVPFYLAHPRLARLERRMMGEVEGGNGSWLMRILRHETGHAIDNAFRLRRRRRCRDVFGPASRPYPDRYRARPGSRRYVQHLGDWYAQAHPTEDFAETFAVWLQPRSRWRSQYADWPAIEKLELMQELMSALAGRSPAVHSDETIDSFASDRRTLRSHYRRKQARYRFFRAQAIDDLLRDNFAVAVEGDARQRTAALLRSARASLTRRIADETGVPRYTVRQILRTAIERSDELRLCVDGSQREARQVAAAILRRLVVIYSRGESYSVTL